MVCSEVLTCSEILREREKEVMGEIQKFEYLENQKKPLDEIKNIF